MLNRSVFEGQCQTFRRVIPCVLKVGRRKALVSRKFVRKHREGQVKEFGNFFLVRGILSRKTEYFVDQELSVLRNDRGRLRSAEYSRAPGIKSQPSGSEHRVCQCADKCKPARGRAGLEGSPPPHRLAGVSPMPAAFPLGAAPSSADAGILDHPSFDARTRELILRIQSV